VVSIRAKMPVQVQIVEKLPFKRVGVTLLEINHVMVIAHSSRTSIQYIPPHVLDKMSFIKDNVGMDVTSRRLAKGVDRSCYIMAALLE
jgi:hypothetical protein